MAPTRHSIGPLEVTGSGAFNLTGVESWGIRPNVTRIDLAGAGQTQHSWTSVSQVEPVISGEFSDVKTLLDKIGLNGMEIPQTTVITALNGYFVERTKHGVLKTGSDHVQVKINQGIAVRGTLRWRRGADSYCTMDLTVQATYDGTNEPFVYTDGAAIGFTPDVGELFTFGKATVQGAVLEGIQGLDIDFGQSISVGYDGGDIFPTWASITTQAYEIRLDTTEVPAFVTYGLDGTAMSSGAKIFLQKRTLNGTLVALATTEHISFTVANNQGLVYVGEFEGSDNSADIQGGVMIKPILGSSAALAEDTAAAIT